MFNIVIMLFMYAYQHHMCAFLVLGIIFGFLELPPWARS